MYTAAVFTMLLVLGASIFKANRIHQVHKLKNEQLIKHRNRRYNQQISSLATRY